MEDWITDYLTGYAEELEKAKKELTMDCKHAQEMLMGTADGIVCRACGKTFANFDEVLAERGEKPAEEKPKKRSKKS